MHMKDIFKNDALTIFAYAWCLSARQVIMVKRSTDQTFRKIDYKGWCVWCVIRIVFVLLYFNGMIYLSFLNDIGKSNLH